MAFAKKMAGVLLAFALSTQVLADSSVSGQVMPTTTAGRCNADMTICRGESVETTTIFDVEPEYVTQTETETSVKTLTTTSTSIVPVVVTSYESSEGLCQIITTTRVKKPQTITLTATVTSIAHEVTGVVEVQTHTYTERVNYLSACMIERPIGEFPIPAPKPPTYSAAGQKPVQK